MHLIKQTELQVHHGLENLPAFTKPIVTIGSFDGVHHGHRAIINRLIKKAKEVNGQSILLTFDPHPRQIVSPKDDSLRLITTLPEKIDLLKDTHLNHLIIIPFTVEFSQINPYDYVEKVLIERIGVLHLIIGYDHKFGLNRKGNLDLLFLFADQGAFTVEEIPEQEIDEKHVSSTSIRNNILNGDIEQANTLLEVPFSLTGKVKQGQKIARALGYPTANCEIDTHIKIIPASGTYAATAICDGESYEGMLYIGISETLSVQKKLSIEINLFALVLEPLYGKNIVISPLRRIRSDEKFDDKKELLFHIGADKIDCELFFSKLKTKQLITSAILNYNGQDHLRTFFPSLIRHSNKKNKLLLIDNASTDDSIRIVKEMSREVDIIRLESNLGFANGYTATMAQVKTKYVAIINSDVEVTEGWLNPLLDILENDPSVVAVQPKVLSYTKRSHFEYAGAAGGLLDTLGYPYCRGRVLEHIEEDLGQYKDNIEVAWTSGAAMVVRVDAFRQAGGFDPDFFAHMEEIDLCWRWRNAGYKLICSPQSSIYHLGGGTLAYQSPKKAYLNLRNNYWMLLKNESFNKLLWLLPIRMFIDVGYSAKTFLSGHPIEALSVIKGILVGMSKIVTVSHKRRFNRQYQKRYGIGPSRKNPQSLDVLPWQFIIRGKKTYMDLISSNNKK